MENIRQYNAICEEGRRRKMFKKIMRKAAIGAMAGMIMMAGAAGVYADGKYDGLTWKTTKAKSGKYVTKFYASGEFTAKVVTKKKVPVKVMRSENITLKKLMKRKDKYILVEKMEGTCVDQDGGGMDKQGYYISYRKIRNAQVGNKYRTYCIFANNRYEDDIIGRCDYCIERVPIICPNCDGNSDDCPYWYTDSRTGMEKHMTTEEIQEFERMEMREE